MTRNSRNRLLLFFALFHLLADVAYAGASVLCVGADEHRTIESEHLAEVGCQASENFVQSETEFAERSPLTGSSDCTDSPLHSEAELVSSFDRMPDTASADLVFATPTSLSATSTTLIRPRARAPAEPLALRAHRTTVLII